MDISTIQKTTFKNFRVLAIFAALLFCNITILAQQYEVKVFAHRGGKLEHDENTLEAFREVYKKGLRGYELDIRRTKDNHLVIFHDGDFKRIFGRDGSIEESTFEEVRALRTKKGNQIPTLDEVLEFFNSKPWLYVEFEMKTGSSHYQGKVLEQYCDELHQKIHADKPPTSDYVMTSFDTRPLKYLKSKYPSAELLFIKGEGLSEEILKEAKALGINRIGCRVEKTTRDMVRSAKKQGFIISLWPGLSIEDFILAIGLESDYICTDVPVAVYEWVKENAPWISLK